MQVAAVQAITDPQTAYDALVAEGRVRFDEAQQIVLAALQSLYVKLKAQAIPKRGLKRVVKSSKKAPPQSLYIYGDVGRGKSMLMDLFFAHAPVALKRRVHFHEFMQEVHARLHLLRQQLSKHVSGDPVALLVRELAGSVRLLCFDELQATDVADASLIFRLFEGLLDAGVVIVATSNRTPATLYTGGVQAERFAKLTSLIEARMSVFSLAGKTDYRTQGTLAEEEVFFGFLGPVSEHFIESWILRLAPGAEPVHFPLAVQGRMLELIGYGDCLVRATFKELCEAPLGPADYLAIAQTARTLVLTDIPELQPEKRNEAKRFMTLVDTLYEHKVLLIATFAVPPERLYISGDGGFEFARTVSRLSEMQSEEYLRTVSGGF